MSRPQEIEKEIQNATEVLKKGGLILYPTDTIWGIGCDATNDEAVEKIFQLKIRDEVKSLILLIDTENKLGRYVKDVPEQAWDLIEFSTKPLTIIYDQGLNVSKKAIANDGSLAIRVTKDPFCKQLIYKFGKPIVSTSANMSGTSSPATFAEIDSRVLNGVDYVVNLRQNEKTGNKASAIIRLGAKGQIKIIRK
ncbi:MAG: L-threonylcarbamoyladenylate synthase [Bacteroidota bacterium]